MTEAATALYTFFSSFGLPAYEENSVPDDVALPYITYQVAIPDWRDSSSISASVWYMGNGYSEVNSKVDEISDKIGDGYRQEAGNGCIWLNKETPFAQVVPTGNDNVKVVTLNIGLQAVC